MIGASNKVRGEVLAGLLRAVSGWRYAEIGVKQGRTLTYLLEVFPELYAVAVDPWRSLPNVVESYAAWDFPTIESEFWENVRNYRERVLMLKLSSVDAAKECAANETVFDLVFIDAAHDYKNVCIDIGAWYPLVREGGYLTGHDYDSKFPGVMRAVDEHFPRHELHNNAVWTVLKC